MSISIVIVSMPLRGNDVGHPDTETISGTGATCQWVHTLGQTTRCMVFTGIPPGSQNTGSNSPWFGMDRG
jgi:hypothetical protein